KYYLTSRLYERPNLAKNDLVLFYHATFMDLMDQMYGSDMLAVMETVRSNLEELERDIEIQVSDGNEAWYENDLYWLDPTEQQRSDNILLDPKTRGPYFEQDDQGFINLNKAEFNGMQYAG